jgi:hypothetical protein
MYFIVEHRVQDVLVLESDLAAEGVLGDVQHVRKWLQRVIRLSRDPESAEGSAGRTSAHSPFAAVQGHELSCGRQSPPLVRG